MRFEILGPLSIWRDDHRVALSGSRQRALLGVLLAAAPEPVPVSRVLRAVWTEPDTASTAAVKMAVSRLRRWWEEHGDSPRLERVGAAYQLTVEAASLDAAGFRAQAAAADDLPEGSIVERRDLALRALSRCRGPVLADLPDRVRADPAVADLTRLHARMVHRLTEDCLASGRSELAVPHLELVRSDRPDDESVAADLALALAASGRQAQGLEVLDGLTRTLAEELGVSPGSAVGAARLRILRAETPDRQETQLARSPAQSQDAWPSRPPAQLPIDVFRFAGRHPELAFLHSLLAQAGGPPGPVVIAALSGPAGVGKTALAVHWAHHVQGSFPDGQLFVNLRGFDPAESPVSPSAALRDCLEAFGVPAERIPAGLGTRAALYRTMIAERRVLVVLDNARDAEQVRPLLPGSRGCLVVVTSRNQLTGLVTAENAQPVQVDVLSAADAYQLLAQRLGADRLRNERIATERIIDRCAGLPLALSILAARSATTPHLDLASVADELDHPRNGLNLFTGHDVTTDIRAVFSWTYRILDDETARLFRLMGFSQLGSHVATATAASLAGRSPAEVRPLLDRLVHDQLLTETAPGRFVFHDLLHAYAAELAGTVDSEHDRHAALGRMLDYYLHSAHAAANAMRHFPLPALVDARSGVLAEEFSGHEEALAWLVTERSCLAAAVQGASERGFFAHSWQLARALEDFLVTQGHWRQLHRVHTTALAAAERAGDPAAHAWAYRATAHAETLLGNNRQAETHLRRALELVRSFDDPIQEAYCLQNLAVVCQVQGRRGETLNLCKRALDIFRRLGDSRGEFITLNHIGWTLATTGDYPAALDYGGRALRVLRKLGAWHWEASVLDTLAYAHLHMGHFRLAQHYYRQSLALGRKIGNRHQQAAVLDRLGDAHQANDEPELARDAWQQAFEILKTLDHPTPHLSTHDDYKQLPDAATLQAKLA